MPTHNNNNIPFSLPKTFTQRDVFYRYSIVFILAFILIIGSGVVLWYTYHEASDINQKAAISDAENFASSVAEYRNFYTKAVLPAARDYGMEITHDYKGNDGTLPLPATFVKDFGHLLATKHSSFRVKLYSDQPFSWSKNKQLDDFQRKAIQQLRKHPNKPFISFEQLEGKPVLRYARADILNASCVGCHNNYQGTPKTNWKVGDVRGVLEITRPMSGFQAELSTMLKQSFLLMLALILSMLSLLFFVLRKLSSSIKISYKSYLKSEKMNKQLTDEVTKREKITHQLKKSDSKMRMVVSSVQKVNQKLTTEINQRKTISRELKKSDVKMRAIVNSVQEVIIVITQQGIIIECNHTIEKMFGYTQKEVFGKNISLLLANTHDKHHYDFFEQYIEHSTEKVIGNHRELEALRKSGDVFPIELFLNNAHVDEEKIFTGTIRDITHRKKTEQMTAKAHQAAIESAQLKGEFLANMSHEIRTPMNGVIGMTEMLLLSKLDHEQQELAYTVKESAEALLTIINDILDFSKIEAGKLSIKKNHFNLMYMIEASLDLLKKEAERKHIDLAFFIDTNVPLKIYSDAGRLRQVLINLLNNALKFTDLGSIILHVSIEDDHEHLRFAVIDTGVGIPKEAQQTLFDMFSQVDGSSSREHGGTGLGLAICKQLVELMGGEIGAKSEVNAGSTFWFTLKIEQVEEKVVPYIHEPYNVLVLNPVYLLSRYYQVQLQQWGMSPTIVGSMNALLQTLKDTNNDHNGNQVNAFDLVAIDADTLFYETEHTEVLLSMLNTLREKTTAAIVLYASQQHYQNIESLPLEKAVYVLSKPIKHTALKLLMNKLTNKTEEAKNTESLAVQKQSSPAILHMEDRDFSVLLAEDNRVNQKVAVAILNKFGCQVALAVNGKEALQKVTEARFDAVFMDCQMPEMDGYEASSRIRQLPAEHHSHRVPIIAFTAHAMKDDDEKCKRAGMDDYLSKPIDIKELEQVFQRWDKKMTERKQQRLGNNMEKEETEKTIAAD